MEYRCISADGHVDLCWLPYDLFISNATQKMKDHMPYVIQDSDGPRWVTKAGLYLGHANGKGGSGTLGSGHSWYTPHKDERRDRMAATGLFSDSSKGILRPTTPGLRIQDQDRDGIQAEVLYGLLGTGVKIAPREASLEFYRIYNDWLSDFCNYDRTRFVGLASVSNHSVEEAVAETHRVARLGIGGVEIRASWDMTPLWDPYWDPLWKAVVEVNLPLHIHTFNPRPADPIRDDVPQYCKVANHASYEVAVPLFMAGVLGAVLYGGMLERYPTLRVIFGETGIGWIPYVLDRMDGEWEGRYRKGLTLKMKPSEYWRRQCRASFQYDVIGAKLLDDLGEETVMWASDYPHTGGIFPDSQEYIKRQFSHLPAVTQRKVTCENAGKLYGLM